MCSNYRPVTRMDRLLTFFGVEYPQDEPERDVYPEGKWFYTFAMLTVNAAGHPLMQRMHAPTDEKRMVVILDPADYEGWLKCSVLEAPRYFRQWNGPLVGEPAPASRASKVLRTATLLPAKPPVQGDLL